MRLNNARHEVFARAIVSGNTGSKAYVQAGYDARGHAAEAAGSRLLRNVEVQARIAELRQARYDREVLDRKWVTTRLMEKAENAESDAAAIRALELLGKHLGMFTDSRDREPAPSAQPLHGDKVIRPNFDGMLRGSGPYEKA
jgi:phage terminase small subunit